MKLRGILALVLSLWLAPALAQVNPGTSPLSIKKGGTAAATASAARTSLGLAIGSNIEAWGANLDSLTALTAAADTCFYFASSGTLTMATASCPSYGRSLFANSTAAGARTTLGLVIGTNVEAWDNDLDCLAALSTTGVIHRTGTGTCLAGTVALSDVVAGTQDTVLGYFGSTALSAGAIPNCTGALIYSTSTHLFTCNSLAGTGTVTSVGLTNTYGLVISGSPVTTSGAISAGVNLTLAVSTLGGDVTMTGSTLTDGPSMAQGTTGTWDAYGTITVLDTVAAGGFNCKLWDGTTTISSGTITTQAANVASSLTLSGNLTTPAGNIRISCSDSNGSPSGRIKFNYTGNSHDSSIYGHRIQ